MNIKIESDFQFSVASIQYSASGELLISLVSNENRGENHYQYSADLGDGKAEETKTVSLLEYIVDYTAASTIKRKTRESYRHMYTHLKAYGDIPIEKVTTAYLQGFITYLQSKGLKTGSVRLYFQKLASVLHDAYKNGLFDDRILQRVKRPKREQQKKSFLTEAELKKLTRHPMDSEYTNIQNMFLFSCMTGLRFGDVQRLRWKDVKRNGKHMSLEFHQQKTDTYERLPLCEDAEILLRNQKHRGEKVFEEESNQKVNSVLKQWCKKVRIKKQISFHSSRHTFCVQLLSKDVSIYTVQQLMGHSDINTTKIYADLMSKTKVRAVKKIPSILYL